MNLVFIYGPPASGKLTVATELSRISSYPLFHNHLTRDLVHNLYPSTLQEHYQLVNKLRGDILEYCARHDTDLIFTYVYDGPEDNESVSNLIGNVMSSNGNVLFVELAAPDNVLLARVANVSRKKHKKLIDRDTLATLLKETPYSSLPYPNILKIDTSIFDPENAAKHILLHYQLV